MTFWNLMQTGSDLGLSLGYYHGKKSMMDPLKTLEPVIIGQGCV